ncbi:DUF3465 domain-containing protein [uncultured Cocleimonas sp.]|uniref:DUF3465 domain-containing protein n=1 Tax=uncultured Cocleimonas sp. TaxID=1051587 RepID=UPI00261FA6A8|nr:DUF3465 domain-containing protein [uncultured Cocleimonas sp.]
MNLNTNNKKRRKYPFKRQLNRKVRRIVFILVAAAIATGINYYNTNFKDSDNSHVELSENQNSSGLQKDQLFSNKHQTQVLAQLEKAKDQTNSRFWVGLNATVIKLLKDDLTGSRHQKFLIKVENGMTLLVSHNIDLAPRVPIKQNDQISLQGRYEWNNRGGVIHWTHHDPKGKKAGGWISVNGKKYK